MSIVWLGDPTSLREELVGGKTANLGRLAREFRVPAGFCLDATVHERFAAALDGDAGARAELAELVAPAYADLARRVGEPEPAVAVRSSAIGEDSQDASFAGQYESLLNVVGAPAVVDAVVHCWGSLSSERALAYRRERGIGTTPRIAVLVQRMVDADVSAIAFSADPVSGSRDIVVVNAARGLGDAIASGEITPESCSVRKNDFAIVERRATGDALIADGDVVAVARLATQLEDAMGWPVDIECAITRGELHLLQCRPVTTLGEAFPVAWAAAEDASLTWEIESTHFDRVLPPLSSDYVIEALYDGMSRFAEEIGSPLRIRALAFNGRIYESATTTVPKEELAGALTAVVERRRGRARHLRADWDERYLPELRMHYRWMRSLRLDTSRAEAADTFAELWRRVGRIWTIHFATVLPAYAIMEELAQLYEKAVGGRGADAFALTQGLAPTFQQLERDLWDLAEAARSTPAIAEAITAGVRSPEALRKIPGGDRFGRAAATVLARHGDVGQHGFGLHEPAFADDPTLLVGCIAQRLQAGGEDPYARLARVRASAEELARHIRAQLAGRPAELARFEEIYATATAAGPLSEEHNYWIDRVAQAHANRAIRAFGARLVTEGALRSPEEIFLLHPREVRDLLREPHDVRTLVTERAAEMTRWERMRPPMTLGAPPSAPPPVAPGIDLSRVDLSYFVAQDDRYVLKGVAASRGVARGSARVMHEGTEFSRLRRGDVLVCRSTNASWAPLFTIASAVVTEIGGSLSHAAVVAREFGVPAVVGVDGATSTLANGEPVEVDGAAGAVRRLFPISWKDPADAALLWKRDDAHNTQVVPPLATEYTRQGPSYGMRRRDEAHGAPVIMRLEHFNGRSYGSTQALRPPDEMPALLRRTAERRRRLARQIRRDWDERYLPELDRHYAWMRELAVAALGNQAAAAAWDELWRRHRRVWRIHMLVTAASYAVMEELDEVYRELVGGTTEEALALTQGLAPALQRLERDLHDLADTARRSPAADAIARGAALEDIRALNPAFGAAMNAFRGTHGDAGASGDHFGSVPWTDDPAPLLRAIAQRLATTVEHPDHRRERLRRRADEIARRARGALGARPDELARFEEVLAAATAAGPLTEEHNYWLDRRNHAFMGRAARAFGARLVRDGALRASEQIFLLYIGEVRAALSRPRDLSTLVTEREAEVARWRTFEAPETIGDASAQTTTAARSGPMAHLLYRAEQSDPSRELRGAPASAGVARGPARLVRDLEEFGKFRPGDVLVCQSSNVSWIPLFVAAAAVVTEVGGPLSHAAVVAREFGIPAVVGTSVALSTLVDGELVEVDGAAGVVRRLLR